MKKAIITAILTTFVVATHAMSVSQARQEALFLSDKMAYELQLTAAQYDAVYEINFDYFLSIRYADDVFGVYWNRRNTDLRFVLNNWQYRRYITTADFYQPVVWNRGTWTFNIYVRYNRSSHFRQPPSIYRSYQGGRNRGSISFYENRAISKPADRRVNNGRSWNVQPNYQPGTNNRQNNTNTGTRKFGTGTHFQGNSTAEPPRNNTQRPAAQPTQKSTTQPTQKPATQSNGSGHFGGQRKK